MSFGDIFHARSKLSNSGEIMALLCASTCNMLRAFGYLEEEARIGKGPDRLRSRVIGACFWFALSLVGWFGIQTGCG